MLLAIEHRSFWLESVKMNAAVASKRKDMAMGTKTPCIDRSQKNLFIKKSKN